MGGRFSQLSYKKQDCLVLQEFQVLTTCWNHHHIRGLGARLKLISFNFCLSPAKFGELMQLGQNEFFHDLVGKWFTLLRNNKNSTVVNGLEFLAGLTISTRSGKFDEKVGCIFDIFDFDETGAMTKDELMILLKSCIRGLSKITVGLAARLAELCPIEQLEQLTNDCFYDADVDMTGEITKEEFLKWARASPKVANLVKHFVPPEPLSAFEAATLVQAQFRRIRARREMHARKDLLKKLDAEEMDDAAERIQTAVRGRRTRREQMHLAKVERNADNGAIFTWGANPRGQLGHGMMDQEPGLGHNVLEPKMLFYFKTNEYRGVDIGTSPMHSTVVCSDGTLHTWGAGVPGALGHLREDDMMDHVEYTPCKADDLEDVIVIQASVGNRHTVALSSDGGVYSFGSGEFGQLGLGDVEDEDNDMFKQAYDSHTGKSYPYVDLPLLIDASLFHDARIVQVACGYYFTVVVAADGSVYSWGEGSEGQLGLGFSADFQVGFLDEYVQRSNYTYMHSPKHVEALEEIPIASVAIGGNHVYAVARDHSVYEWGFWGRRLGEEKDSAFEPQHIEELEGLWVHSISAGSEHTLALCGSLNVQLDGFSVDGDDSIYALRAKFGLTVDDVAEQPLRSTLTFIDIEEEDEDDDEGKEDDDDDDDDDEDDGRGAGYRRAAVKAQASYADRYSSYGQLLRDRFSSCAGRSVLIDRGPAPGVWLSLPKQHSSSGECVEMFALAAKFGPKISKAGLTATSFYPPEKISNLKYYIRPDQIPGKIVIIDFGDDDLALDAEDSDPDSLIQNLMAALLRRVRDAERCRAAAVVIVFDFHDAEPFALEDAGDGPECKIPALMVGKADGDRLKNELNDDGEAPIHIFKRVDSVMQKVVVAQEAGAQCVLVAQNNDVRRPTQLVDNDMALVEMVASVNSGSAGKGMAQVVTIPVAMVSFEHGRMMQEHLSRALNDNGCPMRLNVRATGDVYAWGYGEDGRLGLGDTDNDQIFDSGYDANADLSYQYVAEPELVYDLAGKGVTQISCGDEHSACCTQDGDCYTWGNGDDGRLGHGDEDEEYTPRAVPKLRGKRCVKVVCGDEHTAVLTKAINTSDERSNLGGTKMIGY